MIKKIGRAGLESVGYTRPLLCAVWVKTTSEAQTYHFLISHFISFHGAYHETCCVTLTLQEVIIRLSRSCLQAIN